MTLKDFFTITELKDGLTNPARINDLITILQTEKENIIQNIKETTQQWSTVATTIANTENKECQELFIKLDGLFFINKWLNDAQKFTNGDGENDFLEELVISLLRAVEFLGIDNRVSVSSGIGITVEGLFGHFSLLVREKAKKLCDKWVPVEQTDVNSVENDKEENVEKKVDEIVTESETEIEKCENEKCKSEIMVLEEKREIEGAVELTNMTSSTDVDHVLDSVTKTEITENTTDKDEEMADGEESPDDQNTTTMEVNTTSGIGDSTSGGFQETGNPKTTSDPESESDSDEDEKKDDVIQSDDNNSNMRFSKKSTKSQDDLINNRPSDMDLDYGMVDPLELARQVAIEVEREIDSREQSCSTSTNENEPQSNLGPVKEVSSGSRPEPEPEPTQVSDMVQESAPEKGFSGFDLNQEFSSEDAEIDCPVDPGLTMVSVVSASRAAAAANGLLPVAPLQFEGALGWKGSAATSAFRRIPEGEKTISSSSSQNTSNQRLTRLDFDLNVTENSEDKVEKVQLDLNSFGENETGIISLDWKRETRVASLRQNGPQSPSVSSSSSSMQPSFRNIDLNLNQNNTSLDNNNKLFTNNKRERDESVISIFGSQVEVNRNHDFPPQLPPQHHHQHNQPNGRLLEPSVDFSLGRPGSGLGLGSGSSMPYSNLPGYNYGHNGFTMGPMYGLPGAPIPYMVPPFSQPTQPFLFNMGGSNGAGPSRNSFDLNSGLITEMGNVENNGGLRQFFNQSQSQNHNHNQASSSSVIGGKREEPDGGWELFPINYKHQQPPWQ